MEFTNRLYLNPLQKPRCKASAVNYLLWETFSLRPVGKIC
jgi:hypothetical protein